MATLRCDERFSSQFTRRNTKSLRNRRGQDGNLLPYFRRGDISNDFPGSVQVLVIARWYLLSPRDCLTIPPILSTWCSYLASLCRPGFEQVPFKNPVNPNGKNIENWMVEVRCCRSGPWHLVNGTDAQRAIVHYNGCGERTLQDPRTWYHPFLRRRNPGYESNVVAGIAEKINRGFDRDE